VERGRRAARIELAVAADGLVRRQGLHLDAALAELVERLRLRTHLPVRARADDKPFRQLLEYVVQVGEDESVPIRAPPIGEYALGEDDHVTRLLVAVDDEITEAVSRDPRDRVTSRSSALLVLAAVARPKRDDPGSMARRDRVWRRLDPLLHRIAPQ
jgi:hypothetical protein